MFGFLFRKNNFFDRKRPNFYEGIVTKKEYIKILQMSEREIQRIGTITSIQAGTIKVTNPENEEEEFTFHLDNLVRKCHYYEETEWSTIIKKHFGRFPIDKHKAKFLAKDFEHAQPLLKVLVRSNKDIPSEMVCRVDIPNTQTFLILDYDERFHFLTEDDIKEWQIPISELFAIALANIAIEKIDVEEVIWADKFDLFSFFSGDFSASFMLDLAKNTPFAIGRFGSIVALPTKGSAFVHPLNGNTISDFINSFDDTFATFHREDEVPVSKDYYWFYEEKFEIIPIIKQPHKIHIKLPKKLNQLITNST